MFLCGRSFRGCHLFLLNLLINKAFLKQSKVKSTFGPSNPSSRSLFLLPWHEATKNIATPPPSSPPGREISLSRLRLALNLPEAIYAPVWSEVMWM